MQETTSEPVNTSAEEVLYKIYEKKSPNSLREFKLKIATALKIEDPTLSSIVNLTEFEQKPRDDGNYEQIKWTTIPIDTYLLRRQTGKQWLMNRDLWCDYTGRIEVTATVTQGLKEHFQFLNKHQMKHESFLNRPFFNNKIFQGFGQEFLVFRIKAPIKIIHFPVNNDFQTDELNVPADLESWVKHICTREKSPICLNGYTVDSLSFYDFVKSKTYFPGYREICILENFNNQDYLELVDQDHTNLIFQHFGLQRGGNLIIYNSKNQHKLKKNKNKNTLKKKLLKTRLKKKHKTKRRLF